MKTTTATPVKSQSAADYFRAIVKGQNFMTPYLIGHYRIKGGVAEITEGDFMGDSIYGVTIVRKGVNDHDASKKCDSLQEAYDYVNELN